MNIDLTHPEILTVEQLQKYLTKFIGSDITDDKYELIQLFYKYIAPLPQRIFRTNRLGTILKNNQRQFGREKRSLTADSEEPERAWKLKPPADGLSAEVHGEKHESDRGIYTITMQSSGNKNTSPIKLKRPTTTTNTDQEGNKRMKSDDTNT